MKKLLLYFFAMFLALSSIYNFAQEKKSDNLPRIEISENGERAVMTIEDYTFRALLIHGNQCESFETKKALAVALRSCGVYFSVYGLKHSDFDACTDANCCLRLGKEENFGEEYVSACRNAVSETKGEILTFEDFPAMGLFCLCGGSGTGHCEEFPYVSAVPEGEVCEIHKSEKTFTFSELETFFGKTKEELKSNSFIAYSKNKKCAFGVFGGSVFQKEELKKILNTESPEFEIKWTADGCRIYTNGIGNGFGLNLCSAEKLGKNGKSCYDILNFYFPKLKTEKIY